MSKADAAPARGGKSWMLGVLCGLGAAVAPGPMVLLAIVMVPGVLAWLADRLDGKPVARGVLMVGVAGAIGPQVDLWSAGGSMAAALDLSFHMRAIGFAWATQGVAWIVAELAPVIIRVALDAAAAARAAGLRRDRARLEEEWGFGPPEDGR